MSDQRYVYTTYQTEITRAKLGDLEGVVNEYASEGWRISETLEQDGTTVGLLFERKI